MTTTFHHHHTARRTAVALNNTAVELLSYSEWNEAVKNLHAAVHLMQYWVAVSDNDMDCSKTDVLIPTESSSDAILREANESVRDFLSTCQGQHNHQPTPPAHNNRQNLRPILIHQVGGDKATIEAEASMVFYNYSIALDCAGATAESVYQLLQMSASLLPTKPFHYDMFLVELTERFLLTAQRLGLEQDCIEHNNSREKLRQLARDYNALMHASSAAAA